MEVSVRLIQNDAERDACYLIRNNVFVDEQGVPPWEELDHFDETAQHFVVFIGEQPIGTARLVTLENGVSRIGRVAIEKDYRGKGYGKHLIQHIIRTSDQSTTELILDSQVSVIPFYLQLGFVEEGEVFLDAGIEHRRMRRNI